jgi:hypothetical protein
VFAKVAPLHLFTQPESHNQSFLIKGVGHFSKYERKKPVTVLAYSLAQLLPQKA